MSLQNLVELLDLLHNLGIEHYVDGGCLIVSVADRSAVDTTREYFFCVED